VGLDAGTGDWKVARTRRLESLRHMTKAGLREWKDLLSLVG